MSYNAATVQLDDPIRPAFITAGRNNMLHPVMMLHHRIPWSRLRAALNRVLSGAVDVKLVNALLVLSPENTAPLLKNFKAALTWVQAGKQASVTMVASIEALEAEIFSLPCNLFLGPNNRADDPADSMDCTPADILYNGTRVDGAAGLIQAAREKVYGLLVANTIDVNQVTTACRDWAKLWKAHGGGLDTATAHNAAWWVAVFPSYRSWVNPVGGAVLSAAQAQNLTGIVTTRATTT